MLPVVDDTRLETQGCMPRAGRRRRFSAADEPGRTLVLGLIGRTLLPARDVQHPLPGHIGQQHVGMVRDERRLVADPLLVPLGELVIPRLRRRPAQLLVRTHTLRMAAGTAARNGVHRSANNTIRI
jgi:hypothetical protein